MLMTSDSYIGVAGWFELEAGTVYGVFYTSGAARPQGPDPIDT
jgi:hypothetical protein